jgi:hypothetical protein
VAVDEREVGPVARLLVEAAQPAKLVLDQEADDLGKADDFLLAAGEAGDASACDKRLALVQGAMENGGRVAYGGDGPAAVVERFVRPIAVQLLGR